MVLTTTRKSIRVMTEGRNPIGSGPSRSRSCAGAMSGRKLCHLQDVGARRNIGRDHIDDPSSGRVVTHVDDLERGHQLVDADRAICQAGRPAANLEEVARSDAVLFALVDEEDHLRLLQVLATESTQKRTADSIGHRYGPSA